MLHLPDNNIAVHSDCHTVIETMNKKPTTNKPTINSEFWSKKGLKNTQEYRDMRRNIIDLLELQFRANRASFDSTGFNKVIEILNGWRK
jgi:hypothetical protein